VANRNVGLLGSIERLRSLIGSDTVEGSASTRGQELAFLGLPQSPAGNTRSETLLSSQPRQASERAKSVESVWLGGCYPIPFQRPNPHVLFQHQYLLGALDHPSSS
jgi:hypothetical protein